MNKVEQVARGLAQADAEDEGLKFPTSPLAYRAYLPMARAAIEAMREPTEAMLKAGGMRTGEQYSDMITAALEEPSE